MIMNVWVSRQNAIKLEEKEKKEKEMRRQIIEEAEEYKIEFYRKRELNVENKKASNRENEKVNQFVMFSMYETKYLVFLPIFFFLLRLVDIYDSYRNVSVSCYFIPSLSCII